MAGQPAASHLVLSGSGARFPAFLGALAFVRDRVAPDFLKSLRTVVASSGGAIVGLMLALGYSVRAVEQLAGSLNYEDMRRLDLDCFLTRYGLDGGDRLADLFRCVVQRKLGTPDATLADLRARTGVRLIVTATNVNEMRTEVFDDVTRPDMPLWQAVYVTISMPLLFAATRLGDDVYTDGALLAHFPTHLLEDRVRVGSADRVLGVLVERAAGRLEVRDVLTYVHALLRTVLRRDEVDAARLERAGWWVVRIACPDAAVYDVDLPAARRQELVAAGREHARAYFEDAQPVVRRLVARLFARVAAAAS